MIVTNGSHLDSNSINTLELDLVSAGHFIGSLFQGISNIPTSSRDEKQVVGFKVLPTTFFLS